METNIEGCLITRKGGKVVAIGHHDLNKRTVVFYNVEAKEMGLDELKDLLTCSGPVEKDVQP